MTIAVELEADLNADPTVTDKMIQSFHISGSNSKQEKPQNGTGNSLQEPELVGPPVPLVPAALQPPRAAGRIRVWGCLALRCYGSRGGRRRYEPRANSLSEPSHVGMT